MPNIPAAISPASSRIPLMSMREDGRVAEAGMNRTVRAMRRTPIGTLTRKIPRQDQ